MIGIDLTENQKIDEALKTKGFLERIFTNQEMEYVMSFKNSTEHISGFFSAKEAVMKALEDCKQIAFKDIEIYHEKSGKPFVKLYGKAKQVFEQKNCKTIEISISQTMHFATAICIIN